MDTLEPLTADGPAVQSLTAQVEGRWRVTTRSGAIYDVDVDEGLLYLSSVSGGRETTLILAGILHCTVGDRARFLIDVDVENTSYATRETTEVESIRPL